MPGPPEALLAHQLPARWEGTEFSSPTSYHLLPQSVGEKRGGQLFPEPSSGKAGSDKTGLIILGLALKAPLISELPLFRAIG